SLAALLVVFVAGFVGVAWQAWRAQRNLDLVQEQQTRTQEALHLLQEQQGRTDEARRKARQAVKDYFTQVSENTLLGKPGMDDMRKQLLETALRYYQDFLRESGSDPALQTEVAATYGYVARINERV